MATDIFKHGYLIGYLAKNAEEPRELSRRITQNEQLPFGLGSLEQTNYVPSTGVLDNLKGGRDIAFGKPVNVTQGQALGLVPGVTPYLGSAVLGGGAGAGIGAIAGGGTGALIGAGAGAAGAPALLYLLHRLNALQVGSVQTTRINQPV